MLLSYLPPSDGSKGKSTYSVPYINLKSILLLLLLYIRYKIKQFLSISYMFNENKEI